MITRQEVNLKHINIFLMTAVGIVLIAVVFNYRHPAVPDPYRFEPDKSSLRKRQGETNGADWLAPDVPLERMTYDYLLDVTTNTSKKAPFQTFSDDGRITREALEFAGVEESQIAAIRNIVAAAYNKIEASVASRMVLVQQESDEASGVAVYRIPAAIADGERIFQEMAGEMQKLIGEKKTRVLVSGMNLSDRYSLFGMNDARIEIKETVSAVSHRDGFSIVIRQYDPINGKSLAKTTCNFEILQRKYGRVFATALR